MKDKLYAENPKLKLKKVTTVDGTTEYFKNCKKIEEKFYRMDDQCIQIGNKWYSKESQAIIYDHEKVGFRLKKSGFYHHGIVNFADGKFIFGDFTPNIYYNCRIGIVSERGREEHLCISYRLAHSLGFVEHINEDLWASPEYLVNPISDAELALLVTATVRDHVDTAFNNTEDFARPKQYKFSNNAYNAEESNQFEKRKLDHIGFDTVLTKDARRAARLIGDLSFGCEIEAKRGMLPDYYLTQLGIIICKDGSIGYTPEFVTVPYTGAKGLQSLKNMFIQLNKRCTTDYTCSLHYHIGSVRTDREFLVAIFKLYSEIQADVHAMLPYYKTDPSGVKDKNYCAFLPRNIADFKKNTDYKTKVDRGYKNIFTWLMEGRNPDASFNRKRKMHPNGTQKWNWHSRYFSLNVINMFLSKRQTLEFRSSHAILHPTKAINWLFICVAIVRYCEQNSSKIINGKATNLIEVLNYYGDTFKSEYARRVSGYLIAYYKDRRDFFLKKRLGGDTVVQEDYIEKDYEFANLGMKEIF